MQQDPHEFFKLFVSMIDSLPKSSSTLQPSKISDVLSGKETTTLKCMKCGTARQSVQDVVDISIFVDRNMDLVSAMSAYGSKEYLLDENSCFCVSCSGCFGTEKTTVISVLPNVLCVNLLRYEYLPSTGQRTKLRNEFLFEEVLQINGQKYCLVSAIYHLGMSAHGGHYVCDVQNWRTRTWWHCDDETCHEISSTDFVPAEPLVVDLQECSSEAIKKKRKRSSASNSENSSSNGAPNRLDRRKDVYMLFYVREDIIETNEPMSSSIKAPCDILEEISLAEAAQKMAVEDYERRKCKLEEEISRRKLLYTTFKDAILPHSSSDPFRLIKSNLLEEWVLGRDITKALTQPQEVEILSPPDEVGSDILCVHGGLDPLKTKNCKVVSEDFFNTALIDSCFDVSVLSSSNYQCKVCCSTISAETRNKHEMVQMLSMVIQQIETTSSDKVRSFLLSKASIRDLKKLIRDSLKSSKFDNNFFVKGSTRVINSDLQCEHGKLSIAADKQSTTVSDEVWKVLVSCFPNSMEFQAPLQYCPTCENSQINFQALQFNDTQKRLSVQEVPDMKRLQIKRQLIVDCPDPSDVGNCSNLFAVDTHWLSSWRKFMMRKATLPEPFLNRALRCKHGLTMSAKTHGNNSRTNDCGQYINFEAVNEAQWDFLVTHFSSPSVSVDEVEHVEEAFKVRVSYNPADGKWLFSPEFCLICEEESLNHAMSANKYFVDRDIKICFGAACKSFEDLMEFMAKEQAEREMRRSSRSRNLKTFKISASHMDTVSLLKLKILEVVQSVDVSPNAMAIYSDEGVELQNYMTLFDSGVVGSSELFLVDMSHIRGKGSDCHSLESLWSDYKGPQSEIGFQGTRMVQADISVQENSSSDSPIYIEVVD